ncbi:MAG TPA: dienelactone hydrolase family protein [Candidatus Baltobacteraceae bacterium]|nr:dienelactone hydrolase family protein [Candidatus Baltobacteraceae bacterium]
MATYFAAPAEPADSTPSVVLAMHLYGVDRNMRESADRFAAAGFATIVPDLFEDFGAPDGDGQTDYTKFLPFAQRLTFESVEPKIRDAAAWLRSRFPRTRTAIAGFCMGGIVALRRSYGYSDVFGAAAVWYGAIGETDAARVDVPLVGSFGAADRGIPVESVEKFRDGLAVAHDVAIYPGAGHAFCDDTRAAFDERACVDSWVRTIDFLRAHLAG